MSMQHFCNLLNIGQVHYQFWRAELQVQYFNSKCYHHYLQNTQSTSSQKIMRNVSFHAIHLFQIDLILEKKIIYKHIVSNQILYRFQLYAIRFQLKIKKIGTAFLEIMFYVTKIKNIQTISQLKEFYKYFWVQILLGYYDDFLQIDELFLLRFHSAVYHNTYQQ